VKQMQDEDIQVRRTAVFAARELLAAPEKVVQCIAAGITGALARLLQVRLRPPARCQRRAQQCCRRSGRPQAAVPPCAAR
jgi:hypothetical protein